MKKNSNLKRNVVCCFLVALMASTAQASPLKYHLSGLLPDSLEGMTVKLYFYDLGWRLLDSTYVRNGRFTMTGTNKQRGVSRLNISKKGFSSYAANFALEDAPAVFSFNGHALHVKGGPLTEALQEAEHFEEERGNALRYKIKVPGALEILKGARWSEEQIKELQRVNSIKDSVMSIYYHQITDFVWRNKDNAIGGHYFDDFCDANDNKLQDSLLTCAGEEFLNYPKVKRQIASRKQSPGQPYQDFVMTDKDGNRHRLSEYVGRGRYVLMDVWASWCLGCRLEIPHIKEVYDKYKDSGFDVVLVSIDATKEPWLKAIEKDQSASLGHHLLDAKSVCRKLYGISSVPFNILIDPEGTIVANNLRGSGLTEKMEEVFKKK
ncbi:MAG: AhpC/TSA family protein [Prevotella sp.]|nr:AhpC/TSA family protein [Prevotella sp.]